MTRVVTAVLPSSLVARKVSVEDPPPELDAPLPEQIPPETQQQSPESGNKPLNRPTRRVFMESQDSSQSFAELQQNQPGKKTSREQHQGKSRASRRESQSEGSRAEGTETSSTRDQDPAGSGRSENLDVRVGKKIKYIIKDFNE